MSGKGASWKNDLTISLASGIFFGAAVFDVLPEATEKLGAPVAFAWLGFGILLWWALKEALRSLKRPEMPPLVASALWFHSALEGLVTGLAFGLSRTFGLLVLGAMVLHLLPEFFAAVALMRGAGSRQRTSVLVTFGGFAVLFASFGLTYAFLPELGDVLPVLLALSGGAFVYIGVVSAWRAVLRSKTPWLAAAFAAGMAVSYFIR